MLAYPSMCIPDVHSYMHAYRIPRGVIPRGVMLLKFEPIEEEVPPELQSQEIPEDVGHTTELPEFSDHQPSTFLKGKPQSIIRLP